jgi:hypothetical protein
MFIADRTLYTDATKTRLVEENDPAARFLLVAKGQRLDDQLARRFGLLPDAESKAITPDTDERISNKRVTPAAAGARNKGKASK